jgi:hypothetical protein
MNPLTAAILVAPVVGPLTALGFRRALHTWRRWAE